MWRSLTTPPRTKGDFARIIKKCNIMTQLEVLEKIKYLIEQNNAVMMHKAEKALSSGCVDLESYEDNFLLPKIIFTALLSDVSEDYMPYGVDARKEVKNVSKFI